LHRLGLFTGNDPGCFGFLDPDQVICGVHLIPAFAHGRTDHYMGPSFVRLAMLICMSYFASRLFTILTTVQGL